MRYSLALLAAAAAVNASPFPQAVTSVISPTGSAPAGCTPTYTGSFGIVNINVTHSSTTSSAVAKRQATQTSDGQVQVASTASVTTTAAANVMTVAHVSMITDGQVQGGHHTAMLMGVSQIGDGQVQGGVTMMPVSVISDGQPQAPGVATVTATGISQISDGQPQASSSTLATITGASQLSDGQPQATTATTTGASELSEGQPQATGSSTSSGSSASSTSIAFCKSNDTLSLTLNNGILKDSHGRTGYIASNYQFQFDNPPQASAIYTSGFTVCGNGTLSLGSSSIFWQCRSGSFYNLYDRNWAPQCNAIYIQTGGFVDCS